ncbi:hypothetical protein [Yersinia sp. LJYL362]|uniref:hypothetical protein n=1 Tax=Yersinia sp. LJYL362 TaxID=3402108 RepID=UPI003AB3557B
MMLINVEDYEVIAAYAGSDRSWHDRVSTKEGIRQHLIFSEKMAKTAILVAKHESKCIRGSKFLPSVDEFITWCKQRKS